MDAPAKENRTHGGAPLAVLLCSLLLPLPGHPAAGQEEATLRPGEVLQRVQAVADPEQEYALYLPSGYDPGGTWPILYVMDPGGRALHALERFQAPADELGWIVASSYNSRSDVPGDRNTPALSAMLEDTQGHFPIDPQRIYLAGFSGTARAAWLLGRRLSGHVAGVIGAGAGLPDNMSVTTLPLLSDVTFAFYGAAGRGDFNYEEMHRLDAALDETDAPHRVDYFDGDHAWMPPSLAGDALRWLELQAMRAGLRDVDTAWVASSMAGTLTHARTLQAEGRPLEALALVEGAVNDLQGLTSTETAVSEAIGLRDQLRDSDALERAREERRREARDFADYDERVRIQLARFQAEDRPLDWERVVRALDVEALRNRAGSADTGDAEEAGRLLAHLFTMVAYYRPAAALDAGDPALALGLLRIANAARPGHPRVCLGTAQAQAQLGNADAAMEALRCLVDADAAGADSLERDPYLAPLRDRADFQALLASLRGSDQGRR